MPNSKNTKETKFAIYEASGKYFLKYEGQEEREINKSMYLQLKEVKEKDFKNNTKK